MGWQVRQKMLDKQDFWREPGLFTLTVDRRGFDCPKAAYEFVTDGRFVWRLFRALGVKRWVWALEFQQKTGTGWPHWHLLIDLADLPNRRLDLKLAWSLWRDKWKIGGLDLSAKKVKLEGPEHAVMYLTKYLTKMPEGGFPAWVLRSHGIRFVQGCRQLGPLVNAAKPVTKPENADAKRTNSERRPLVDRMALCRLTSRAYLTSICPTTGAVQFRFLSTLPVAPQVLEILCRINSDVPGRVVKASLFGRDAFILEAGDIGELRRHLENRPHRLHMLEVERRENVEQILARNEFARREAMASAPAAVGNLLDKRMTLNDDLSPREDHETDSSPRQQGAHHDFD